MTDLTEALDLYLSARLEAVHTVIPGKFLAYEGHQVRRARVQPTVRLELGTGPIVEIPPIDGVPVVFPSAGEASFLFPIKPGDGCLILFSEAGFGKYMTGRGDVQDPDDQSRFSLTDAIAIPGLWAWTQVPKTTAPDNAVWVGYKGAALTLSGDTFSIVDGSGNTVSSSGSTITLNGNLEVDQ